jgi:hypothetical protein
MLTLGCRSRKSKVLTESRFLWVNLQLMNLCEVSERRKDRVVKDALKKLPTGLDAIYVRSLKQINKQEPHMRTLGIKTLRWVIYAQRPLTTTELRHALAAEEALERGEDDEQDSEQDAELDEIDVILGACANLLVEDNSVGRNAVRPIHYSVQEFITQSTSHALLNTFQDVDQIHALLNTFQDVDQIHALLNTFQDVDQIHASLAETCISHLESKLLGSRPCSDPDSLYHWIYKNPFVWYAACAFDYHLKCCTSPSEKIIGLMKAFLELPSPVLASVLQLKALRTYSDGWPNPFLDFDPYGGAVDKRTVVYSTKLYDVQELECCWRDLGIPPAALHRACSAGLKSAISRLLAGKIDVDEQDDNGLTAMYYAAVSGNADVVRMLLEEGAGVNAQGGYFGNALQAASSGGHEAIVRLLLDNKADVNAQGGEYGNALQDHFESPRNGTV